MNRISEITKRDIFDLFHDRMDIEEFFDTKRITYLYFGRLEEMEFLKRLYELENMPSSDSRYPNAERDSAEVTRIRFQPVTAYETAVSIDALCNTYSEIIDRKKAEPLLADLLFILDFLCIHPFSNGNGRMIRLLTLLLLYRHGYMVGKYISIESLIEKTKNNYYATLEQSTKCWHEGENDF